MERFLEDTLVQSSDRITRPVKPILGLSQYTVFYMPDTS